MWRSNGSGWLRATWLMLLCATLAACGGGGGGSGDSPSVPAASLTSLTVTPASSAISAGESQQFIATAGYSDGSSKDVTAQAQWAVGDAGIASVDASGKATALAVGTTQISVVFQTQSSSAELSVSAAELQSVELSPQQLTLALGLSQTFALTGTYSDGTTRDLSSRSQWTSSDASVVEVAGDSGVATARGMGSATIQAVYGDFSQTATVQVSAAVSTGLAVTSATVDIPKGTELALTATLVLSDGSQGDDVTQSASWSSADPAIAAVAASTGEVSGLAVGKTTINVRYQDFTAAVAITVGEPEMTGLLISPEQATAIPYQTQAFTAQAQYSDGSVSDVTALATWQSSDPSVATIGDTDPDIGTAEAVAVGETTISATLGDFSASTAWTVQAAEVSWPAYYQPYYERTYDSAGVALATDVLLVRSDDPAAEPVRATTENTVVVATLSSAITDAAGGVHGMAPYGLVFWTADDSGARHLYFRTLRQDQSQQLRQISSATLSTDAVLCGSRTYQLDATDPDSLQILYALAGDDGLCNTDDDPIYRVADSDAPSQDPESLALPLSVGSGTLTYLRNQDGDITAMWAVDHDKQLIYYPGTDFESPVVVATEVQSIADTEVTDASHLLMKLNKPDGTVGVKIFADDGSYSNELFHTVTDMFRYYPGQVKGDYYYFADTWKGSGDDAYKVYADIWRVRGDGSQDAELLGEFELPLVGTYSTASSGTELYLLEDRYVMVLIGEPGGSVFRIDTAQAETPIPELIWSTDDPFDPDAAIVTGDTLLMDTQTSGDYWAEDPSAHSLIGLSADGEEQFRFDGYQLGGLFGVASGRIEGKNLKLGYSPSAVYVSRESSYHTMVERLDLKTLSSTPLIDSSSGSAMALEPQWHLLSRFWLTMPVSGFRTYYSNGSKPYQSYVIDDPTTTVYPVVGADGRSVWPMMD